MHCRILQTSALTIEMISAPCWCQVELRHLSRVGRIWWMRHVLRPLAMSIDSFELAGCIFIHCHPFLIWLFIWRWCGWIFGSILSYPFSPSHLFIDLSHVVRVLRNIFQILRARRGLGRWSEHFLADLESLGLLIHLADDQTAICLALWGSS